MRCLHQISLQNGISMKQEVNDDKWMRKNESELRKVLFSKDKKIRRQKMRKKVLKSFLFAFSLPFLLLNLK